MLSDDVDDMFTHQQLQELGGEWSWDESEGAVLSMSVGATWQCEELLLFIKLS